MSGRPPREENQSSLPGRLALSLIAIYALTLLSFFALNDFGLGSVILLAWLMLPPALCWVIAKYLRSGGGAWLFFATEIGIIATTAWFWFGILATETDPQAGIAIIFIPLWQLAGLGLIAATWALARSVARF